MLGVIIEQILEEVEVLKGFDYGREDKGNPSGVIPMRVVLNRQSFHYLLLLFPTTRHNHVIGIILQLFMLLADMDNEQYHLIEEVLLGGLQQVDDQRAPEELLSEGLILVLERTYDR